LSKEDGIIFGQKEFDLAWQEFFKDRPKPENEQEEKIQMEEFAYWYNYVRKQSDTNKTPADMYEEIYGEKPPKEVIKASRMINFGWDDDYDEELIGLIEELKNYDYQKEDNLNYNIIRKKLEPTINKIIKKGENSLNYIHELLENEETWSCLFSLEILSKIKNKKSIPYLIKFIEKNENGDCFENCEIALEALVNIGNSAVEEIICSLETGLKNKIYHSYLFETLSKINNPKGKEFRLGLLNDYLNNPQKYQGWFDLTMFICNFNDDEKEVLPFLKELKKMNLSKEENLELDSAIEMMECPELYEKKINLELKEIEPLIKKIFGGVVKKGLCPCGSGKKYEKCCLKKEREI